MGKLVGWINNLFKVEDNSKVQRTIFDKDGYLYQLGTKITTAATVFNDMASKTGIETLTNKTLMNPVLNGNVAGRTTALDLSVADVTLSAAQMAAEILEVTTGHATNAIIAPATAGQTYWVVNNHATLAANIKKAAGVAVTIAATKKALVYFNGTDYIRLTADQ